jgi:predicted NBD/HSP70 family sugar kinase
MKDTMKTAAIPSSLRKINRRLILRHMVQVAAAARGELAEVAGTSQVTVGKIVDELLEQGVLETAESKRAAVRPGRPGQNLRLNTRAPRFILLQLGVAHTRIAHAALGASMDTPWPVEIETPVSAREWELAVQRAIAQLVPNPSTGARAGSAKHRDNSDLWGILVSVPGIVDEPQGKVLFSPNLHWSEGVDFRHMLGNILSVPVELVQEIRALALGQLAASPSEKDFLLVDFGHGLGGAAVLHGGLYHGALPLVGELGHTPVLDNQRLCGCGSVGCVETLLSRRGLFASLQEHLPENKRHARFSWNLVEDHIAAHGLEPWLKRSLQAGAANIAGAMNALGLGRVVITGSLTSFPEEVKSFLASEIKKGAMWAKFGDVAIDFAPRRRMRGMISVGIERLVVGA